ncbi:DMP19 family protein [Microlunatus speluncae]|uniref:DMP19 family protein n=1 Tax=Microlunatus speluncae TaxID=2594267 RepID=UPI0012664142|nr:hypothetical protein [Microlunatus speluncae]
MDPLEESAVWNRAAGEPGPDSRSGDRALAAVITFDGLVNNGGLAHACDVLSSDELAAAEQGYRYLRLPDVADIVMDARSLSTDHPADDEVFQLLERRLDELITNDTIDNQFRGLLYERPYDFAPVSTADLAEQQRHWDETQRLLGDLLNQKGSTDPTGR